MRDTQKKVKRAYNNGTRFVVIVNEASVILRDLKSDTRDSLEYKSDGVLLAHEIAYKLEGMI